MKAKILCSFLFVALFAFTVLAQQKPGSRKSYQKKALPERVNPAIPGGGVGHVSVPSRKEKPSEPAIHPPAVKRMAPDNHSSSKAVPDGKTNGQTTFSSSQDRPRYASNRIFVKFRDISAMGIRSFDSKKQRSTATQSDQVNKLLKKYEVVSFQPVTRLSKLQHLDQVYEVKTEGEYSLDEAVRDLEQLPNVEYAEKVPIYYVHEPPNDPFYNDNIGLYHLDLINAINAWDYHNGTGEIYVAIVDDAFLFDHPDLAPNVDRSKCYDVADNDNDPRPPATGQNKAGPFTFSHGTHVAGIAGAVNNNGTGIASLSGNRIKLFGIKTIRDNTDDTEAIGFSVEGVEKAIENGADVINMSFGGGEFSQTFQDIITAASENGVVFVASAGNGGTESESYPAAYDHVISVANTDQADRISADSQFGGWIDISAPGTDIRSTVVADDGRSGGYTTYSGTSMASPMVAGLAGLILAQDPTLSADEVEAVLKNTAVPIDLLNPGYETKLGAGRINAAKAILAVRQIEGNPVAQFVSTDNTLFQGQSVSFVSHSLGGNLQYQWNFPGGQPATSSGEAVSVTYGAAGTYNVSLTVSNGNGTDDTVAIDYIDVEEVSCATLNFPQTGERTFHTYAPGNTPVFGHNFKGHTRFANLYDFFGSNMITGGLFAFKKAVTGAPDTAMVTFKVWEPTPSGVPGEVIAAKHVLIDDIVTTTASADKSDRGTYTEVIFDKPVPVPDGGEFFMGFEINYKEKGDTVGLFSNNNGTGGAKSYVHDKARWLPVETVSEGLSTTMEIAPVIVEESLIPVGEIISESGTCSGGSILFQADAIENVSAYRWTFPGGNPSSSGNANVTVQYNNPGTYEVKLELILEDCADAKTIRTKIIKVANCNLPPQARFSASTLQIALNDSVRFFDESENTTGRIWTFEGGTPPTSSLANPYVTYNTPGEYTVSLNAQNPEAASDIEVKEQYITVLEENACNFTTNLSLNDPFPGEVARVFEAGPDGYVAGNNSFNDMAKAEFFNYEGENADLHSLSIMFGEAHATHFNSFVTVAIYDDSGPDGAPGNIIATKNILIGDIERDIENDTTTTVTFDEAVSIEGPFYAGVVLSYEGTDTVALVSSNDFDRSLGTAWEQLEDGTWAPVADNWGFAEDPLNISLYIKANFPAVVHSAPMVVLKASAEEVFPGQAVRVNAAGSKGFSTDDVNAYAWSFPEGVAFDADTLTQEITFPEAGVYTIEFSATNNCGETESARLNIIVADVDCGAKVTAINDPFPGTPSSFLAGNGGGYVTGNNIFKDKAKAEFFELEGSGAVQELRIAFDHATATNATSTVTFAIWDNSGENGTPGKIVGSKDILIRDIINDISRGDTTRAVFEEAIEVEGSFYGGVILSYNGTDTTTITSTDDGEVEHSTAWEQLEDSSWNRLEARWGEKENGLKITQYIGATVETNVYPPKIQISSEPEVVDEGQEAVFGFSSSSPLKDFTWHFPEGATVVKEGKSPAVVFEKRGTYTISLTGTGFCGLTDTVAYEFTVSDPLGIDAIGDGKLKVAGFPNPFNESTKILYKLEKKSQVRLEVFTVMGKSLGVLVNEEQDAGTYEVIFEAATLPPGVYLYRINIGGGFVKTNRLIKN